MSNVAVQGRPIEDPWLTWSVPEFGPGYWPLPPEENYPGLAEPAIPEIVGYPGTHDGPVEGGHAGVDVMTWGVVDEYAGADVADLDISPPAPSPHPGYYGPLASWGNEPTPTFAQTMVGWGMLVFDEERGAHRPTLRMGYTAFWTGLVGGLIWGFATRRSF